MRIVSGRARGIRLEVPAGDGVRPTEDKVKESMFNTLGNIQGKRVLELFSGSGALGLEALSRGAAKVVMVERQPLHAQAIRRNLAAVQKAMGQAAANSECRLEVCDISQLHLLPQEKIGGFDLIIADPPYHQPAGEYGAHQLLLDEKILQAAAPGALIVLEHATDVRDLPWAPRGSGWQLIRERTFGIRTIAYGKICDPEMAAMAEEYPQP